MERKHVHTIAEEYHLQHGSVGEGAGRHIYPRATLPLSAHLH
jgi:hypothetical protein